MPRARDRRDHALRELRWLKSMIAKRAAERPRPWVSTFRIVDLEPAPAEPAVPSDGAVVAVDEEPTPTRVDPPRFSPLAALFRFV